METKLFFTDLDGTLLTTDKKITRATRQALDALADAGHKIALISGRPLKSILEVKERLGLDYPGMFLVGFNGGLIYDYDHQDYVLENRLTLEDTCHLLKEAEQYGIHCHTYTDEAIVSRAQTEELTFYQKTIHLPSILTDDIMGALEKPPFKCLAICLTDKSRLEALRLHLLPWAEGRISLIYSNDYLLEMFPATSGKGRAVELLCRHLEIPVTASMAAGDQENDISMLQAAGTGVAMANGAEAVKKAASLTTSLDNDHDGLVAVLKEFFSLHY